MRKNVSKLTTQKMTCRHCRKQTTNLSVWARMKTYCKEFYLGYYRSPYKAMRIRHNSKLVDQINWHMKWQLLKGVPQWAEERKSMRLMVFSHLFDIVLSIKTSEILRSEYRGPGQIKTSPTWQRCVQAASSCVLNLALNVWPIWRDCQRQMDEQTDETTE